MSFYKYRIETVAFHITNQCSGRCSFCYFNSGKVTVAPEYNVLEAVLSSLIQAEVKDVVFLGGDPCEYDRLLDLAEVCKAHRITVTVISNTHNYHDKPILDVKRAIDNFEATIHGPTGKEHDTVTLVDGSFEILVKNLQIVQRAGGKVGILFNITPDNYNLAYKTIDTLVRLKGLIIDHVLFQRIIPQGRAKSTSKYALSKSQVQVACEDILHIKERFDFRVEFEDPFPFCAIHERFHHLFKPCQWGYTRASVDMKGNLSRCGADPRFQLGNILQKPLLDIWNHSRILDDFRKKSYLPQECRECGFLENCGGGCPLACEILGDHGIDYLYAPEMPTSSATHLFRIRHAQLEDLSGILRIEWSNFEEYTHRFSANSLRKWYDYISEGFYVVIDQHGRVRGFACLVPLTEQGYEKIRTAQALSLTELTRNDVSRRFDSSWVHIEVIASDASRIVPVGRLLLHTVLSKIRHANGVEYVTTCPISPIGTRLCQDFGFQKIASASHDGDLLHVFGVSTTNLSSTKGEGSSLTRGNNG